MADCLGFDLNLPAPEAAMLDLNFTPPEEEVNIEEQEVNIEEQEVNMEEQEVNLEEQEVNMEEEEVLYMTGIAFVMNKE